MLQSLTFSVWTMPLETISYFSLFCSSTPFLIHWDPFTSGCVSSSVNTASWVSVTVWFLRVFLIFTPAYKYKALLTLMYTHGGDSLVLEAF